ncbi:MAG: zinc-dependent alcohol dehydrogenase family protein [Proteobacteria bacterium]|jgi:propanol-preferring alcohol dehydrogenase|nr:zinc-dependent alcohol dehydrogenase family protein [Desulfocapsa sp.]MBU3945670.1 zinc-dependent alcohol dehydrogenase family protein [Pseudomonadota bacterium]MCG2743619.1 zinc-dependent alcohol dehydrogenase family protein [Desulfobacteraceae bacterium]MBU3984432.1 zinc-dependent alcohol dehydrogenase family protein [Pseudomonadota bacterium]MBU4030276.1 zinc-dependent alcohol dehydrogenase family protein [Pseudomonadota bacterium]
MKAMVLKELCSLDENHTPLELMELPDPVPAEGEILVKVSACGVCHTELDEIEGRTPPPHLPMILGHQVIGRVEANGSKASAFKIGDRVGIAWIYSACGICTFCLAGNENLCPDFQATGRDVNGGYAQYMTVPQGFVHRIPQGFTDSDAAPLLCAGAIGYRSLRLTGLKDGQNLGLTGFGASGHLVLKMVRHLYPKTQVFIFARSAEERAFSLELGAVWAGEVTEESPEKLHCIIDTTPAWEPVVEALKNLDSGGRLVINAIRKEERDKDSLLRISYPAHLWLEKEIKSVANISRRDVSEFLALAAVIGIRPEIQEFALEEANKALLDLKTKRIRGGKVLKIN